MNPKNYKHLRDKVYNNTATREERIAFYRLLLSGDYDSFEDAKMMEFREGNIEPTEEEQKLLQELKTGIDLKRKGRRRFIAGHRVWLAAATVSALAIAGAWLYQESTLPFETPISDQPSITITGPNFVHLPDSSTVKLKAESTLSYKGDFGVNTRDVELEGEAFFEVKHDIRHPFRVKTGKVYTTVLGTTFNIKRVSTDIAVTVLHGKVAVGDEGRIYETVSPDQQVIVNTKENTFIKERVKADTKVEWAADYLIFDDLAFFKAIKLIEKRFDVVIKIDNHSLKNCIVNAKYFNNESLTEILQDIEQIMNVKTKIEGKDITIKGGIGCD